MFSVNSTRARRRWAVAGTIVVALGGCGSAAAERTSPPAGPTGDASPVASCEATRTEGADAEAGGLPPLDLPCLGDGPDVSLKALTGRPTLINLWASWCGPCREEMPMLQQAFEAHGQTVRFLGVATRDDPAVAAEFVSATGVTYPHAVDRAGALLDELGLPGLPVTLALDPAGQVITTQIGQMTSAELSTLIKQLEESGPG